MLIGHPGSSGPSYRVGGPALHDSASRICCPPVLMRMHTATITGGSSAAPQPPGRKKDPRGAALGSDFLYSPAPPLRICAGIRSYSQVLHHQPFHYSRRSGRRQAPIPAFSVYRGPVSADFCAEPMSGPRGTPPDGAFPPRRKGGPHRGRDQRNQERHAPAPISAGPGSGQPAPPLEGAFSPFPLPEGEAPGARSDLLPLRSRSWDLCQVRIEGTCVQVSDARAGTIPAMCAGRRSRSAASVRCRSSMHAGSPPLGNSRSRYNAA